jgi:hypothetical protein
MKLSRLFRSPVAVLAAIVVVSGSVFAFAASISRSAPYNATDINAGQFKVTAAGYSIDDIKFTPIGDQAYAKVTFGLTQTGNIATSDINTEVKVKLVSGSQTYTSCIFLGTNPDNPLWECNATGPVLMSDVDELNVVAVSKAWTNPAP